MIDRLSQIKSGCDVNVSKFDQNVNHRIIREFNRGRSLAISQWAPNIKYLNDDFKQDLVSYNNVILACKKSHTSDTPPVLQYDVNNSYKVIGVDSDCWDIALTNITIMYVPEYDKESGTIRWILSDQLINGDVCDIQIESPFISSSGTNSAVLKKTNSLASGEGSAAIGLNVQSLGDGSFSQGIGTIAKGLHSSSFGFASIAKEIASHAEGIGTIANNNAEHAQGVYNVSNLGNTLHSVGIGIDEDHRKNAHEITTDGKYYIYGIGDYDGTNAVTANAAGVIAKDVATVINELTNIISQITESE